jgi:hypothetical protein
MQNSSGPFVKPRTLFLSSVGAIFVGLGTALLTGAALIPATFRFNGDSLLLIAVGALLVPLALIEIFTTARERARVRGPGEL